MSFNIEVEGGTSVRLPTAGKYCDRDIVITATGGGAEPVIDPLEITENGTYATPDGVDGYSPVTVNVPIPDGYIQPSGTLEVTENGTHDVTEYAAVNVNVEAGGGGGENYAKFYVTPTSSTSITIQNPLGGLAKAFTIRRLSEETPSSRRIYDCVGSYDLSIGAVKCASTSDTARYAIQRTTGSLSNSTFKITEGLIQVYRYNSANIWDTTSEYEVEIWQ